jgi:ubiquinone/menaquinone biosynthesis C-methylase UbiE
MDDKVLIANYELNDYKYCGFWEGRRYEHESEVMLLKKLFSRFVKNFSDKRIIDIGGAYGRLADLYASDAKETILADYSTHELQDGISNLKNQPFFSKISYLALNAYKMPLRENSIDVALSVRVMHHLKDTKNFFGELNRVMVPGGVAIIEFANNCHILNRVKRLLKSGKQSDVTEVSHKVDAQGIKENQVSVMYNFSPSFIKKTAIDTGFSVLGTFTCSFLRLGFIKRIVPLSVLLFIESLLQSLFASTMLTPSIFIVMQKISDEKVDGANDEVLCCPICTAPVTGEKGLLTCVNKHTFPQDSEMIIDLRDPRPEEINY